MTQIVFIASVLLVQTTSVHGDKYACGDGQRCRDPQRDSHHGTERHQRRYVSWWINMLLLVRPWKQWNY